MAVDPNTQPDIVKSMAAVVAAKFPMIELSSGLRFTDSGYHSKGMAGDFSNGGDAGTPEMKALAAFIADNYGAQTIQLIHQPFDRNIGDGGMVGDGMGFYGAGTMSEHRNHVHWAVREVLGAPSGGPVAIGQTAGFTTAGNPVSNVAAVIKSFAAFATSLSDGDLWRRVAYVFAGVMLALAGAGFLGFTNLIGSSKAKSVVTQAKGALS